MYGLDRHSSIWLAITLTSLFAQLASAQDSNNITSIGSSNDTSTAPADCHCGFFDPNTTSVYTDSIIVYFNESTSVPQDTFSIDSFRHTSEKGYSIYYVEGAKKDNVWWANDSTWDLEPGWLNLNITGYTRDHLVSGAQLQTLRQDIQYGTFRAFLKSPAPWAGGSALTMRLQHNETCSAELDLMNMDDSTNNACMQTSTRNQDPVTAWGMNYTVLESNYSMAPWDFWEYRVDWSPEEISWYAGDLKTRTVPTSNASLVDLPTAFYLKHWSNGDANFMQGPPENDTTASVGWLRMFFNSSVQTTSQAGSEGCDASMLCSTEDESLRLTTSFNETARQAYTLAKKTEEKRSNTAAIAIMVASLVFSAMLLAHGLARKASDKKTAKKTGMPVGIAGRPKMPLSPLPSTDNLGKSRGWTTQADYEMNNLKPGGSATTLYGGSEGTHPAYLSRHDRAMSQRALLGYDETAASSMTAFTNGQETPRPTDPFMTPRPTDPFLTPTLQRNSYFGATRDREMSIEPAGPYTPGGAATPFSPFSPAAPAEASTADLLKQNTADIPVPEGSVAAANPGAKPVVPPAGALPQQRTRVDYLAGLVAVCSLLVSCEHFILTYVPAVVMEYLPQHYSSEYWARRTIEPFFFNEVWVGIFFTTSTRFLCSGYLRTGNLKTIAEKVVCRCPRLMIPITAVILLEYFLMDLGATKYLEYVPSLSWSTWPSTSVYDNFGYFFDETLQLFYLIPNAAPQLTWNYCTGVLWTIPVQLQNSWLVLLGAVIIKEIKTPWKRFGYYGFCIINHWYALSWGSYFWAGLLLADLDITYKYRKWIQSRWWAHYPLLTLAILTVLLSLANDLFSIHFGYTFSTQERGIHPDPATGLRISVADPGYPAYTEPKLNGLLFAVGSQYVVELSTVVQAVLSTKVFLWLFPHVFTIYLIHGLVWWSMGSLVCVYFASQMLPYWLNILLTAIICYATLFAVLPIVTPVMEMLGKEITKGIWVGASEEPAEWRPSSFPFSLEEVREMVHRRDDEVDGEGEERARDKRPVRGRPDP